MFTKLTFNSVAFILVVTSFVSWFIKRLSEKSNDFICFLFRYEDLVVDPVGFLKSLSNRLLVQLDDVDFLHDDVTSWLANNTRLSSGSRYSTSRNSLEQIFKWRSKISMNLVLDIQKACEGMMHLFGYLPVHSIEDLRNTSVTLLSSMSH